MIAAVLRDALVEIRTLAYNPDLARHPGGQYAEIGEIADLCHNLPGAVEPQPPGEFDGLVYVWQTANPFQKRWLHNRIASTGADMSFLELAPQLPRPPRAPATRPTWRHWQRPRDAGAFRAIDSATLADLVRSARALEKPDPRFGTARQTFIESMLGHLDPAGRHILRPRREGEIQFVPDGPEDLRQYRAILTMVDGALVVDHPRLRAAEVDAMPTGLSLARRLMLAAVPWRTGDRDVGQWMRAHRDIAPGCPLCPARPQQTDQA